MPREIQPNLLNFIADQIHSVAQLESLLLLQRAPDKLWSIEETARILGLSAEATGSILDQLCAQGFLIVEAGAESKLYRYGPKTVEYSDLISDLERHYRERRVSIISLIYGGSVDKLRSFSDAFRLRKKKED